MTQVEVSSRQTVTQEHEKTTDAYGPLSIAQEAIADGQLPIKLEVGPRGQLSAASSEVDTLPLEAVRFDSEPQSVRSGEFGNAPQIERAVTGHTFRLIQTFSCLTAGTLLHVGVGFLLLAVGSMSDVVGGGGHDTVSVQVELASADSLSSAGIATSVSDALASATADVDDGGENEVSTEASQPKPRDEPQEVVQEKPVETATQEAEIALLQAPQQKVSEDMPDEKKKQGEVEPEKQQDSTASEMMAQRAGQSAPSGSVPSQSRTDRRSASSGEISRFQASLWKSIQSKMPRRRGLRGTVEVTFTITPDGTMALVRITKSSGRDALDQLVLKAVKTAHYKKPPDGMTETQLTYRIPIRFR